MHFTPSPSIRFLTIALLSLAACSTDQPLAPQPPPSLALQRPAAATIGPIVRCPTRADESTTAIIGPAGGKIEIAGHSLTIPEGAVRAATRFTLHAPPGRYLRVDVTAEGAAYYEFEMPVTIVISYDRCRGRQWLGRLHSAWYIGEHGGRIAQEGVDDPVARTVTFETRHLSTYAVLY